jgi:DNA (cytosine-5)-methyltransferase 1
MKVLSLFSGVGGFDMGLEAAGMETVFQCEYDKHCLSVLERHWPDVPRWGDVSTLTGAYILKHAPEIDVVAWGSPCQDLSVAGKREGLEGKQSNLFYEGIRIIKELRDLTNGQYPRISIWENVVGALTSNNGNDFGVILDEMAKAGALVQEWSVLDAQYFGVPHRRRRVFVLAAFDPTIADRCPNPILPVARSLSGNIKKSTTTREKTARTTGESITFTKSRRAQSVNDHETWVEGEIIPTLNQFDIGDIRATTAIAYSIREDAKAKNFSATELDYSNSLSALQPSTQSHHAQMFIAEPTMAVRRLTPLECERLMGWRDDHTKYRADGTEQSDTARFKQIGNGVASPVAKWIAEQIIKL